LRENSILKIDLRDHKGDEMDEGSDSESGSEILILVKQQEIHELWVFVELFKQ